MQVKLSIKKHTGQAVNQKAYRSSCQSQSIQVKLSIKKHTGQAVNQKANSCKLVIRKKLEKNLNLNKTSSFLH